MFQGNLNFLTRELFRSRRRFPRYLQILCSRRRYTITQLLDTTIEVPDINSRNMKYVATYVCVCVCLQRRLMAHSGIELLFETSGKEVREKQGCKNSMDNRLGQ